MLLTRVAAIQSFKTLNDDTGLVEESNYGSVVCNDKKEKYGYYIVECIGAPWTDQETHQLMCDAVYRNSVPRAPF